MSDILRVEKLTKTYSQRGKQKVVAVEDISFSVREGELVGLLGPNGAGKTTTIKCICGLIYPDGGGISIDGIDILKKPRFGMEKISAVLEGNRNIYWRLTVKENLKFFSGLMGTPYRDAKPFIEKLIKTFDLEVKQDTQARFLSRGMQQKLAVACALVKNTDLILLDEPTLGLDVESSVELRQLLKSLAKEFKKTILLSSHQMNVVKEICERVIIINNGKVIIEDAVENLLRIFRTSIYGIEVAEGLTREQRELIESEFEASIAYPSENGLIEVELPTSEKLYSLINILKEGNTKINSIKRKDPDFEEIFLKILRNKK
jgi:ABC-2 type transport system ATP-binding protein